MGGPGARRPGPWLLLLLALLPREAAAAEACAPGCSEHYLGDKNCDKECYTEACEWDRGAPRELPVHNPPPVSDRAAGLTAAGPTGAGDCETWELKRMFVMGPFYRDVQSVEYQVRSGRRAATAGRAGLTVRTTRRRSTRRGRSGT